MRKINWVIPGGRSKRMFLMLGCVSWILMLLCSCGRNLPDSEQVIKRYLKEKYNQEFQIVHTERKNIGQNFGEFINTGEAVSLNESDDAFSFTIYEDGRITDNYPKVILGNQIKQDIYSILDHGKLEYTNVDIRFIESDQEYVRFLYNGIIIKHQKTEPTYTKTSLFLCEKRRFFMARREKGVVPIIYFEKERGKSF
ncbi:MAG: hypothetical protein ACLT08_00230 [Roseburia inulinivorans]